MLKNHYEGKAWKFQDNISTDAIAPGRYMYLRSQPQEYAKHLLEGVKPEFAKDVKTGDFIVAGNNFGCGSSREIAVLIIKLSGVGAILAKSFGRIFYRNAINNGLLLIQCNTDIIPEGALLSINVKRGEIRMKEDAAFKIDFQLGEVEKSILNADGLLNLIETHGSFGQF
jgi:3-isopropylmalate/(R)-2-methylmalate dehydratase small subunit